MTLARRPLALDLFCGAGGLSEGLRIAGVRTIAANDIDASAGATFTDNHAEHGATFVLGDICDAKTRRELIDAIGGEEIDLVAGGPPCQAFSQMRNHDRKSRDPRNRLYRHLMGFVDELQPKCFVMENVVGMQNLSGGSALERILENLSLGGAYSVEAKILDSADFGVPQTRRRVLIIGVRKDIGAPLFPRSRGLASRLGLVRNVKGERVRYALPDDGQAMLFDDGKSLVELADPSSTRFVTVEQAISDLVGLKPSRRLERKPSDLAVDYPMAAQSAYQKLMRGDLTEVFNADVPSIRDDTVRRLAAIPPGGNFRDIPPELAARYLDGSKWGPHLGRETLSRKHYYAYRKLHPDYFSWTLNTKTDCVYHYSKPRALSVREFARLHSFPDHYRFMNGDRHSRYAQIGNAVPPLLGKAIAEALVPLLTAGAKATPLVARAAG